MKNILSEIFTDALGRPEIKNILGVPALTAGLVLGALGLVRIVPMDWTGWGIYMGFSAGLITVTAKIGRAHV